MRHFDWLWGIVLLAVCLAGGAVLKLHGGAGPAVRNEDRALRIVSLAPSVTEILFALGKEELLVGVTDRCDYPSEAKGIERVGGFGAPNTEKLLTRWPDLVIAAGMESNSSAEFLRRSGVRLLDVRIGNFDELFDAIRQIGGAVGACQEAERLVAGMQARLDAIASHGPGASEQPRPKVFLEIGDHPLLTAGASSFLDDLVARAGGINVAHAIQQAYPIVNPEIVVQWNPDVILTASMGRPHEALRRVSQRIGWAEIAAVKRRQVIDDIDPDLLYRPGPRLVDGVELLAKRLNKVTVRATTESEHAIAPR